MRWICLLFIGCLCGCGFHLRGLVDMPTWLHQVAIINEGTDKALAPLLKAQLNAYTIQVSPTPEAADYWLILTQESFQQQIGGISSTTTPRQYQLIYTVDFTLNKKQGAEIIPPTHLTITRQITLNSNKILGSNEEEALTQQEMRREAVNQLLNRLSRVPQV